MGHNKLKTDIVAGFMVAKLIKHGLLKCLINRNPFEWVELKHAECEMSNLGISIFEIILG